MQTNNNIFIFMARVELVLEGRKVSGMRTCFQNANTQNTRKSTCELPDDYSAESAARTAALGEMFASGYVRMLEAYSLS